MAMKLNLSRFRLLIKSSILNIDMSSGVKLLKCIEGQYNKAFLMTTTGTGVSGTPYDANVL